MNDVINSSNTYTLNIDKALKKKIDATKRQQNVLYEYTKGGLVITADAATFELLRIAANIYYTNSVSFVPFTRILLLVKYRLIVYAGCSCSCTRIVVCTLLRFVESLQRIIGTTTSMHELRKTQSNKTT
jgi:hypothetical protein